MTPVAFCEAIGEANFRSEIKTVLVENYDHIVLPLAQANA